MPKTYEELRADERCIYQAFTKVSADSASAMGRFVNGKGFDADDVDAVFVLAERYGFTKAEVTKGDQIGTSYNFDTHSEIIACITGSAAVRGVYAGAAADFACSRRNGKDLMSSPQGRAASWHAIYGRTGGDFNVRWQDDQRIYRDGPPADAVAVCFIKR